MKRKVEEDKAIERRRNDPTSMKEKNKVAQKTQPRGEPDTPQLPKSSVPKTLDSPNSDQEYQRRILELEKINRELNQQNQDQIQKIQKFEHSAKDWEQVSTGHQKRIQELEKIVNHLEKTNSENRRKYIELQRSLEELKIEYPNVKESNECLQKELDMMKIRLNEIKNKDTEPAKKDLIDYDCVLQVENFRDISNEGWILKIPQKDEFKQKKCGSVFALVGLYNKGKTFILNQLTGSLFGSGQSYTTEGISMKEVIIDNERFFVLDTAGTNSPIDLSKIEERDKKITEVFIQDLALNIADYFILVVNDFTSKDQKILKRIVQYVKDQKQFKSIFVIHNFQNVKEEALHNYVWQNQVIKIFSPVENGEKIASITVRLDDGRAEERKVPFYKGEFTTHYSLVNNTSEYGIEFNRSSIQLIKDTIKRQICHENTNTLYETLKQKIKVSLSISTLDITEKENIEIIKCATIDNWAKIVPSRGLKFLQQNEFEPIYDSFEAEDHYHIILDIPGMSLEHIGISFDDHLTTISGNRLRDHQINTSETHRRFGTFNLEFRIPLGFKSEPTEELPEIISGILKLKYPKRVLKTVGNQIARK